jgi:hypothetical protein
MLCPQNVEGDPFPHAPLLQGGGVGSASWVLARARLMD